MDLKKGRWIIYWLCASLLGALSVNFWINVMGSPKGSDLLSCKVAEPEKAAFVTENCLMQTNGYFGPSELITIDLLCPNDVKTFFVCTMD